MATSEIKSEVTGTVWKIEKTAGQDVNTGDEIMILESMKMEIPALAQLAGRITEIHVSEGQPVDEGDTLATIEDLG